jgi:hypothetical protein
MHAENNYAYIKKLCVYKILCVCKKKKNFFVYVTGCRAVNSL